MSVEQLDFFICYIPHKKLGKVLPIESRHRPHIQTLCSSFGFFRYGPHPGSEHMNLPLDTVGQMMIEKAMMLLPDRGLMRFGKIRSCAPYTYQLDMRYYRISELRQLDFPGLVTLFWLKRKLAETGADFRFDVHTTDELEPDHPDSMEWNETLRDLRRTDDTEARSERMASAITRILNRHPDRRNPHHRTDLVFRIECGQQERRRGDFWGMIKERIRSHPAPDRPLLFGAMEGKNGGIDPLACDLDQLELFLPDKGTLKFGNFEDFFAYFKKTIEMDVCPQRVTLFSV